MPDLLVNTAVSLLAPMLLQEGFEKNAKGFFRLRSHFADYLSIQVRGDKSAIALNVGVQPFCILSIEDRFEGALRAASEVDCYVRARLSSKDEGDCWIRLDLEPQQLAMEIALTFEMYGKEFFDFFSLPDKLIDVITIENIRSGSLPIYFSMMTKSRLALLGAKLSLEAKNNDLAKAFAEYGLSVAGMAVNVKRDFKNIIAAT